MKPNPKPYADQSKAGLNHVEQNSSLDWPYTNDPKQKTITPKYPKKTAPPEGAGGGRKKQNGVVYLDQMIEKWKSKPNN